MLSIFFENKKKMSVKNAEVLIFILALVNSAFTTSFFVFFSFYQYCGGRLFIPLQIAYVRLINRQRQCLLL